MMKNNLLGFTFIEITLAVLILGAALAVFLGLQSAAIQKATRDKKNFKAMLVARSIMSVIELDYEDLEEQDGIATAIEQLEKFSIPVDQEDNDSLAEYNTKLLVKTVELPLPNPTGIPIPIPIKKVSLTIFWGENPEDAFEIHYLTPGS